MQPPAPGGYLNRGPAPERLEGRREGPARCQLGQQRRGTIPQCCDAVTVGLTGRAGGEMALDLDALGTAQSLIQVGVKLVVRNVPHDFL